MKIEKRKVGREMLRVMVGNGAFDEVDVSRKRFNRLDCRDSAGLKFNVSKTFLTSLDGCPKSVKQFQAMHCRLESLDCAYLEVDEFHLDGNQFLTTLDGGPTKGASADYISVYDARGCGLTSLGVPDLSVKTFNVNFNPLPTLNGGPKEVSTWHAIGCGLTTLGIRYAVVEHLRIAANKSLRGLLDGPRGGSITCDEELPLLGACGRVKTIYYGNSDHIELTTAFRVKLELRRRGQKQVATFMRQDDD